VGLQRGGNGRGNETGVRANGTGAGEWHGRGRMAGARAEIAGWGGSEVVVTFGAVVGGVEGGTEVEGGGVEVSAYIDLVGGGAG
jgi:hypothetical protein